MRIVSLVPGATEVIAALGLAENLVGISHECDYPSEIRHLPVLVKAQIGSNSTPSAEIDRLVREAVQTGTDLYAVDTDGLKRVQPDLVITQELCDVCAITPQALQTALHQLPTAPDLLSLHPTTLDDVLRDIVRIGMAVGQTTRTAELVSALRKRLTTIAAAVSERPQPTIVCLEWLDPPYIAGHWVPQMIAAAGGTDVLGQPGAPSRQVRWADIAAASPEIVILAPCGFDVLRTLREIPATLTARPEWKDLPAVSQDRVFAVDAAAYFSRPGPRLIEGVAILARLLHPEVFGTELPLAAAARVSQAA